MRREIFRRFVSNRMDALKHVFIYFLFFSTVQSWRFFTGPELTTQRQRKENNRKSHSVSDLARGRKNERQHFFCFRKPFPTRVRKNQPFVWIVLEWWIQKIGRTGKVGKEARFLICKFASGVRSIENDAFWVKNKRRRGKNKTFKALFLVSHKRQKHRIPSLCNLSCANRANVLHSTLRSGMIACSQWKSQLITTCTFFSLRDFFLTGQRTVSVECVSATTVNQRTERFVFLGPRPVLLEPLCLRPKNFKNLLLTLNPKNAQN
jgi:hypothetical protein